MLIPCVPFKELSCLAFVSFLCHVYMYISMLAHYNHTEQVDEYKFVQIMQHICFLAM